MWKCRKCNQVLDVPAKICRACGGIIEEMPEDQPLVETGQGVDAVTPSMLRPSGTGSTGHVAQSSAMLGKEGADTGQEFAGPDWTCPHCGEIVPGNFDECWKCLTTKAGEQAPNARRLLSEAAENEEETKPDDSLLDAEVFGETDSQVSTQAGCARCGSTKMIRDVTVLDHGDSDGKLKAVVVGNPDALIFKHRLYGEIRADICGMCGHIELRVANPRQLYRHYQKGRGLERTSDATAFSASPCLSCGMLVEKGISTCPHCGATQ